MLVFNSEMHLVTSMFLILELMMFSVQLYLYLIRPNDTRCVCYLVLLILLMYYNLTCVLFPDPGIHFISLSLQNMLAYGSGFLMATYFPFYFYKSFDLTVLRFHALYGTSLFLLLPYLLFFVLMDPVSGDLKYAMKYGLISSCLYLPTLLFSMFKAVPWRRISDLSFGKRYFGLEIHVISWSILPWILMCLFAYLNVAQWIEVIFTNTGFVVNGVSFLHKSGRFERLEKMRLRKKDAMDERQQKDFKKTCLDTGLSCREAEIAQMLCLGKTYKGIGEMLYISERTVNAHVQRIFHKTGVRNKIELQQYLGFEIKVFSFNQYKYAADLR